MLDKNRLQIHIVLECLSGLNARSSDQQSTQVSSQLKPLFYVKGSKCTKYSACITRPTGVLVWNLSAHQEFQDVLSTGPEKNLPDLYIYIYMYFFIYIYIFDNNNIYF